MPQVATHAIGGLADAVGAVQRRSQQLFAPANGLRNPAMAARAATTTAAEGIGKLLEAVNAASSIIKVPSHAPHRWLARAPDHARCMIEAALKEVFTQLVRRGEPVLETTRP